MFKKLGLFIILVGLIALFGAPRISITAQGNPVLVLDAATPAVDIVVTPTNGAAGVVYIEMDGIHLSMRNSANVEVLTLVDKRISVAAIQLAEGAKPQTLHLERLPGLATARAQIIPQTTMPAVNVASTGAPVTSLSTPMAGKVALAPASSIPVSTSDQANMVTLQFPGQDATIQLVDSSGSLMLTSQVGHEVSGLSLRLAPGQYSLNLANHDLTTKSEVVVALSSGPALMLPAATPTPELTSSPTQTAGNTEACTATITANSVNLRSGPGTAYSILGYTTQGSILPVGGLNREGGWLLVQSQAGAGWISNSVAELSGNCQSLPVYDIPIRNANTQQPGINQQPSSPGQGSGRDHENEGEGNDD